VQLQSLELQNFKNHPKGKLRFNQSIVCFTGLNGMGKTNLLDAIHYLSSGKSAFNSIDSQNILFGEKYFTLSGNFKTPAEKVHTVFCGFTTGRKKVLKLDDLEYEKLLEHYGRFPCVLVSPLDLALVTEGNEERRKFIDSTLSFYDKDYLLQLVQYNQVLVQRNSLLKLAKDGAKPNQSLLQVYNEQLSSFCSSLFPKREKFIAEISGIFEQMANNINNENEKLEISYISQLQHDTLLHLLEKNIERDIALSRTESGIHKDKLEFGIEGQAIKKFGSQGQQKSYVLALKLAQAKLVEQKTGKKPILLLDDLFDRLDDQRAARLLALTDTIFDQIFITDTSQDRLKKTLENAQKKAQFFQVENGQVSETQDIAFGN